VTTTHAGTSAISYGLRMEAEDHGNRVSPIRVLRRWFEAHQRGDLAGASTLMASTAAVRVLGRELVGFENFMKWYRERQAFAGPSFRYDVIDVLGGQEHAAAIIRISEAGRTWRQVAVFRVEDGIITSIVAYEDEPQS